MTVKKKNKDAVVLCEQYCIGCGLCKSELKREFVQDDKGYAFPILKEEDSAFLKDVCPVLDEHIQNSNGGVWGNTIEILSAFSNNIKIRRKASSGGVLTSLAVYLLETKSVDGIIHISSCADDVIATKAVISETADQVIERCGSRYSISSPWKELSSQINIDQKYAAIGKPCDIAALRRYNETTHKYVNISHYLSFFCAGMPSKTANENLLRDLGCPSEKCISLTYRGNGWPGYATAKDKGGETYTMEYSKAWGGILGRDVHPFCRLCMDGIGEYADIACGDGWFIKNNEPDFSEREGRNVVLVRNQQGKQLMDAAVKAGYIMSEDWDNIKNLAIIQKYQYTRKATMLAKLLAYRICGRKVPEYDRKTLRSYSKDIALSQQVKIFLGTLKRLVRKRI